MGDSRKKQGLFDKFFSVLSGKPSEERQAEASLKGKFAPNDKDPVDLVFVKNFTRSGGKFLYCETKEDAVIYLNNIIKEANIQHLYCCENDIQSILDKTAIEYDCKDLASSDAFCTNCEFLVSFNGGIMISDNQTKGKKLSQLPTIFIAIAHTSQIVENLREGLTGIRARYKGNIPSNITTIKGPIKDSEVEISVSGNTFTKELYLLLLEDQI